MQSRISLEAGNTGASSQILPGRRLFCALFARVLGAAARDAVVLLLRMADNNITIVKQGRGDEKRRAAPGSVLKPLVVTALMDRGRLRADETYLCPGRLMVRGRQLNCVHPRTALPMDVPRALAYSCNCAVAHWAERFRAGELQESLGRYGLQTEGEVRDVRLPALGEENIRLSAEELLRAYRRLRISEAVRAGMCGAVSFGTAQWAALPHVSVAGKTGSGGTMGDGGRVAWFAGFAPSQQPEVMVVAMAAGGSGGSDAAPLAREAMVQYFGARA